MGAVAEGYVFVLQGSFGLAVRVNGQVQHIAGVMAFRTLQSVLLAFGIEMWTSGFEIGSITLWVLVNMDAVLTRWKIVKLELEGDT